MENDEKAEVTHGSGNMLYITGNRQEGNQENPAEEGSGSL